MNWFERVEAYLDELERTATTIDMILDETRVYTVNVQGGKVSESTRQLQENLVKLEEMIAQRELLLRDPDAPQRGLTLSTKLLGTLRIEDARLAKRCRELSATIEMAHTRAVSLFVCQYHLADLTTDLVLTLTRTSAPQTYQSSATAKVPIKGGGGLFNEAA